MDRHNLGTLVWVLIADRLKWGEGMMEIDFIGYGIRVQVDTVSGILRDTVVTA